MEKIALNWCLNRFCVVVLFPKCRENFNKKINKFEKSEGKGKEFQKKETEKKFLLNAIHNKNTCDYNDGRLSTEQTSNWVHDREPGGEEEKSSHEANRRLVE